MTSYGFLIRQFSNVVWADEACLSAAATVSPEKIGQPFGFSFGSVHATLVHMLSAQSVWIERLTGDGDPTFPDPLSLPTLQNVSDHWHGIHERWRVYLSGLTDSLLDAQVEFTRRDKRYRSTRRIVVAHVFDHATHHRGQLNSLIKLAGGTPFDYGQMTWSRAIGETIELS